MSNIVKQMTQTSTKLNNSPSELKQIFRLSPLIRITLISFYLALTLPLPFLAQATSAPISPLILWIGIGFGFIALFGALSERVIVDEQQLQVTYPQWVPSFFRQKWSLAWEEIKDLRMRTTGQGGLVYYFITQAEDRAYLLPMRVAGFARLVKIVEEKTGIDATNICPLAQAWMYLILLVFTLFLLLIDVWVIWTGLTGF
jgi:hypothetical protein